MKYTIDTTRKTICLEEECMLSEFMKEFGSGYDKYKILPKIDHPPVYPVYPPIYPTYVPDVYTPIGTSSTLIGSEGTGSVPMNEENNNE